jgi:hypothetical protein
MEGNGLSSGVSQAPATSPSMGSVQESTMEQQGTVFESGAQVSGQEPVAAEIVELDTDLGEDLDVLASKPASSHDKLVELSQLDSSEAGKDSQQLELSEEAQSEQPVQAEETFEESVIRLQQKTIEILAKSLEQGKKSELADASAELMRELTLLLKSLNEEKNEEEKKKKKNLIMAILGLISAVIVSTLSDVADDARQEVKRA